MKTTTISIAFVIMALMIASCAQTGTQKATTQTSSATSAQSSASSSGSAAQQNGVSDSDMSLNQGVNEDTSDVPPPSTDTGY